MRGVKWPSKLPMKSKPTYSFKAVQLLEKSWKEKDPNFEQKFEQFSDLLEQIDSQQLLLRVFELCQNAGYQLENLKLIPIIEQTRDVFVNTKNVKSIFLT
ncbi:hypothetical protein CS542_02635 [Pedobacter sp. IW39]|nr:hypothetical protein CS542_02635 [Pedobacter sp. IW39]